MTPYGGLTFFVVLAALLLPAVILGLLGRRSSLLRPLCHPGTAVAEL